MCKAKVYHNLVGVGCSKEEHQAKQCLHFSTCAREHGRDFCAQHEYTVHNPEWVLREKNKIAKEEAIVKARLSRKLNNALDEFKKEFPKAKPKRKRFGGVIYILRADDLNRFGLNGYIGQTIDPERRKKDHLEGKFDGTQLLVKTIIATGCTPVFDILATVSADKLDYAEREYFTKYSNIGWTLFNRADLSLR